MINTIKVWIQRPYFFNLSKSFRFLISLSFGGFIFFFLYFLTPFNLSKLNDNLLEYVAGISFIVTGVLFFVFFFLPFAFKDFFKPETWTIGRNIIFVLFSLLISGFCTWYYNYKIKSSYGLESLSLGRFIYYTFIVGLFPSIIIIFFNEKAARKRKIKSVKELLLLKKITEKKKGNEVIFTSENNNDIVKITVKNLVYITSQANYACFFVVEENVIKEYVLRMTLKNVEYTLSNYSEFYRCHKSYIINSNFVNNLEGNARGYQLLLMKSEIKIPVSRSFPKELLKNILK